MPLSLNDDEYNAVQAAAAPIHPLQRDAFLNAALLRDRMLKELLYAGEG
jgi:hypothetical protein